MLKACGRKEQTMVEMKELSAEELEKVSGGHDTSGSSAVRKPDGKLPIDITVDIKCPNCSSDDFEPVELVFPIENLRCKSCGTIFELPELSLSSQ